MGHAQTVTGCWLWSTVSWVQAEVRCHAVLCKTEHVAQMIASQLRDRLVVALDEFRREKVRSQNSRTHHRAVSLPNDVTSPGGGGSVRTKFLKLGQNFRPPIGHSNSAPKLGSITEGDEGEQASASDADDVHDRRVGHEDTWLADDGSEHDCDGSVFSSSLSHTDDTR